MAIYPKALWVPGPPDKVGYEGYDIIKGTGAILHSMVGSYESAKGRLDSSDRASWHFSVLKNGTVYQHYDTDKITWHGGTLPANIALWGIEHEGGGYLRVSPPGIYIPIYSEPLTPEQLQASVELVHWLHTLRPFPLEWDLPRIEGLHEHNDFYATACPSGRIPHEPYIITGGRMYTDAEIDAKIGALLGAVVNQGQLLVKNTSADREVANALFNHVATHPGGGMNQTMMNDLRLATESQNVAIAEFNAFLDKLKAAAEDLGGGNDSPS